MKSIVPSRIIIKVPNGGVHMSYIRGDEIRGDDIRTEFHNACGNAKVTLERIFAINLFIKSLRNPKRCTHKLATSPL